MKLIINPDCGNAPKKELIKDLTIAFAAYDLERVMSHLAEDIIWTLVGDEPVHGKEKFRATLLEMSNNKATGLTIHTIVTHGKEGAVNGEMLMEDGKRYAFADFYEFNSAAALKVKSIVSYVIQVK